LTGKVIRYESDGVIIEAAALARNESTEVSGLSIKDDDVQPVWIKIKKDLKDNSLKSYVWLPGTGSNCRPSD